MERRDGRHDVDVMTLRCMSGRWYLEQFVGRAQGCFILYGEGSNDGGIHGC